MKNVRQADIREYLPLISLLLLCLEGPDGDMVVCVAESGEVRRDSVLHHLPGLRNKGISTGQHPPPPARISEACLFSSFIFCMIS